MKKATRSPLCSAFVIPGLGQIINQNVKKGVCLLLSVLILFVLGVIKLVQLISVTLQEMDRRQTGSAGSKKHRTEIFGQGYNADNDGEDLQATQKHAEYLRPECH